MQHTIRQHRASFLFSFLTILFFAVTANAEDASTDSFGGTGATQSVDTAKEGKEHAGEKKDEAKNDRKKAEEEQNEEEAKKKKIEEMKQKAQELFNKAAEKLNADRAKIAKDNGEKPAEKANTSGKEKAEATKEGNPGEGKTEQSGDKQGYNEKAKESDQVVKPEELAKADSKPESKPSEPSAKTRDERIAENAKKVSDKEIDNHLKETNPNHEQKLQEWAKQNPEAAKELGYDGKNAEQWAKDHAQKQFSDPALREQAANKVAEAQDNSRFADVKTNYDKQLDNFIKNDPKMQEWVKSQEAKAEAAAKNDPRISPENKEAYARNQVEAAKNEWKQAAMDKNMSDAKTVDQLMQDYKPKSITQQMSEGLQKLNSMPKTREQALAMGEKMAAQKMQDPKFAQTVQDKAAAAAEAQARQTAQSQVNGWFQGKKQAVANTTLRNNLGTIKADAVAGATDAIRQQAARPPAGTYPTFHRRSPVYARSDTYMKAYNAALSQRTSEINTQLTRFNFK